MRFAICRSKCILVLLALSARIKHSLGVMKEIIDDNHEPDDERPAAAFTARGFNINLDDNEDDEHRYIVKFKSNEGFQMASFDAQIHGTHVMNLERETSEVMTLQTQEDVKRMEEREDVEYVERDHKVYLQSDSRPYGIDMVEPFVVSDEFMSNQKVCIIDSGYTRSHPDLPSGSGRITGTSNGAGSWFKDGNGHGTHVAGIIAAMENDEGVIGINQGGLLRLHIVRVFNNNGNWAWASSLVAAANACVENGANVINMSLGGPEYSQFEEDAFQDIYDQGVLLVAAGGNDGSNGYLYPAAYSSVIGVGAVNSSKNLASFSQRNDQIDLTAPGVGVRSTFPPDKYQMLSGTSMATPHVSGVAALVWSHFPSKSAKEIREALQQSAEDRGTLGKDNRFGYGIVNARRAFDLLSGECIETCEDSPEDWYDSDGEQYDCDWYSADRNCEMYGNAYENFGKTANEACCACGGGKSACDEDSPSLSPTKAFSQIPSQSPSQLPTSPSVTKAPSVASTKSPAISSAPTQSFTSPPSVSPTIIPTKSPSRMPSKTPTETPVFETSSPTVESTECHDDPDEWFDADGEEYDCDWYGEPGEDRCVKFGNYYENFGKTAKEACCVCGGGTNPCQDVENWYDSDGEEYNCEWYSDFKRCEKYGDLFENDGYTANEACCVCKMKLIHEDD